MLFTQPALHSIFLKNFCLFLFNPYMHMYCKKIIILLGSGSYDNTIFIYDLLNISHFTR